MTEFPVIILIGLYLRAKKFQTAELRHQYVISSDPVFDVSRAREDIFICGKQYFVQPSDCNFSLIRVSLMQHPTHTAYKKTKQ